MWFVNHTHFPKEDQLPDWERWDIQDKKGDCVEGGKLDDKINILNEEMIFCIQHILNCLGDNYDLISVRGNPCQ
jgi:hypothetical protein